VQIKALGNGWPSVKKMLWAIRCVERTYGLERSNIGKASGRLFELTKHLRDNHVHQSVPSYDIQEFLQDAKGAIFASGHTDMFKVRDHVYIHHVCHRDMVGTTSHEAFTVLRGKHVAGMVGVQTRRPLPFRSPPADCAHVPHLALHVWHVSPASRSKGGGVAVVLPYTN
jgi:hypothetical protein